MKNWSFVSFIGISCLIAISQLYGQNTVFENASLDQIEFLTDFAMDSMSSHGDLVGSAEEIKRVVVVTEEHIKRGIVRLMKKDGVILGFFGLLNRIEGGKELNVLSHFFVNREFIGKGYGTSLFKEAMRTASEELHWEGLLWESDPYAAGFYRKMGATQIGQDPNSLDPSFKVPVFIYILKK